MQITIEDISPVEKKVDFELPWADVAPKLDKAYSDLRRDVRLKGFRPGKVPRNIVERMYRRQVEDEVARELIESSLGQAIQEKQIQPVAPPTVDNLELKSGEPFKFSARVACPARNSADPFTEIPDGNAAVLPAVRLSATRPPQPVPAAPEVFVDCHIVT